MTNFITRNTFIVPSFDLDAKEEKKLFDFLKLLDDSNVSSVFPKRNIDKSIKGGRPSYSYHDMFATVLYSFAFGSGTLRSIETSCKYDLRYMYLMNYETPIYSKFCQFINDVIVPNRKEVFKLVTNQIINECNLTIDDVFVDGSKFEADANKYKFVWKPTKHHEKLSDKIRTLLSDVDLSRSVPSTGIIDSKLIAIKVSELSKLVGNDITLKKKYNLLCEYLTKSLEYEEKERICGPNRNSYYKTDYDATATCLKEDYYSGLGSNMHAAYNTQLSVSKGIICSYYVSQSRNGIKDFIPVLKSFYDNYGCYPKRVCADAGYGSYDNYEFLNQNNIENYVKYYTFDGNVSGRNPDPYYLEDDGSLKCLNGNTGYKTTVINRHPKTANSIFYRVEGCNACPFKGYCKRFMKTKDEDYKIFEVNEKLVFYKQEAFNNLLLPKGIELRVNRSSQVEGAFGVIKQDMNYNRLRRIKLERVETEFMLTFLGYNIRKLFRFFKGKAKFNYWVAPPDLKSEEKKKPSAKRLSNRVNKKKTKSVNEEAKSKYKYK